MTSNASTTITDLENRLETLEGWLHTIINLGEFSPGRTAIWPKEHDLDCTDHGRMNREEDNLTEFTIEQDGQEWRLRSALSFRFCHGCHTGWNQKMTKYGHAQTGYNTEEAAKKYTDRNWEQVKAFFTRVEASE